MGKEAKSLFNIPLELGPTFISSHNGMEALDLPSWLKQIMGKKHKNKYIESNDFQTLEKRQHKRVIPERKETCGGPSRCQLTTWRRKLLRAQWPS